MTRLNMLCLPVLSCMLRPTIELVSLMLAHWSQNSVSSMSSLSVEIESVITTC